MKKTLQTKRSKSSKGGFRALYAKPGRQRKMRAATSADAHTDLESDIPNVGIGRALLVILLLHVVAIAAIYTHFALFDGGADSTASQKNSKVAVTASSPVAPAAPIEQEIMPVSRVAAESGLLSERYIVVTGDTYSRIAEVRNVDLTSLRALNGDRALRAGIVLDLPAELSSRPVSVGSRVSQPAAREVERPTHLPERVIVPDVEVPRAIVVKPRVNHAQASQLASAVSDSGQRYTVQSGDTLWRISTRYGVSKDKLLRLNGITDVTKLKIGLKLKIPTE